MCAWDVDLDVLHIVETDPTAPGGGNALLRSWIQVVGSGARLRRGVGVNSNPKVDIWLGSIAS